MTSLPILDAHHGGHCAPRTPFFRRVLAALRRKPVPEAASPVSGAVSLLGAPLGEQSDWLADARRAAELAPPPLLPADFKVRPAGDGSIVIGADSTVTVLPRRTRPGKQPWETAQQPAVPDVAAEPERHLVFGQAPVATVLEAEQMRREYFA